jgi:protein TonB
MRARRAQRRTQSARGSGFAFTATLAVHIAGLGLLFSAPAMVGDVQPPVYSVELVAAPRPQPEERRAPEAVERPAERPAPVSNRRPRRTTVAEEAPPPEPEAEREPAPRTTPDVELAPDVEPSTGTDPATVKTTGVEFPYPEYLRNVVAQVYRRWQRPSGDVSLRAEALFFVHRDGTISNFQFVRRAFSPSTS